MPEFHNKLVMLMAAELLKANATNTLEEREAHVTGLLHDFSTFTCEFVLSLARGNVVAANKLAQIIYADVFSKLPDNANLAEVLSTYTTPLSEVAEDEGKNEPCNCLTCQRDRAIQSGNDALEELEKLVQNHNGNGKLN